VTLIVVVAVAVVAVAVAVIQILTAMMIPKRNRPSLLSRRKIRLAPIRLALTQTLMTTIRKIPR